MNCQLREGNFDAVKGELMINPFVQIEGCWPEIFRFHPYTQYKIKRTFVYFCHAAQWFGFGQDFWMISGQVEECGFYLFDIRTVFYANYYVDSSCFLSGVIDNISC